MLGSKPLNFERIQRLNKLGKLLKSHRVRVGLSLDEACNELNLNMSKNTLISYETGRCEPNIEVLLKLSLLYKVELEELIGFSTGYVEYNLEPLAFTPSRLLELNKQFKYVDEKKFDDEFNLYSEIEKKHREKLKIDFEKNNHK